MRGWAGNAASTILVQIYSEENHKTLDKYATTLAFLDFTNFITWVGPTSLHLYLFNLFYRSVEFNIPSVIKGLVELRIADVATTSPSHYGCSKRILLVWAIVDDLSKYYICMLLIFDLNCEIERNWNYNLILNSKFLWYQVLY